MFHSKKLRRVVVPVLIATALPALAWAAATSGTSTPKPTRTSTARPAAKPATKSRAKSAAKPAAPAVVPKSPLTISITSRIRKGNLIVSLDGVPVFHEEFEKPALILSQTTTWDPVSVAAGKHKLTAKVVATEGKTYLSESYDLEVSRTAGVGVHIRMKGDKLTVGPAS